MWQYGLGYTGEADRQSDVSGIYGLVIAGSVGVGKPRLAAANLNAVPDQVPTSFYGAIEIVYIAKDAISTNATAAEIQKLNGVLVIDDLTAIRPTDFSG